MKINSVTVRDFRNLKPQTLQFRDGINIFIGKNAQGKTNLLESVYLCCLGKSPRSPDRDLICRDKQSAFVKTEFQSIYGEGCVELTLSRSEPKKISVNSVRVAKVSELLGYVNAIYFSPDEMKIVKSGPVERRRFLDIDLCQIDKAYFFSLSRFNKILEQRNKLLKTTKDKTSLKEMLSVWDAQLAREAEIIVRKRTNFTDKLKEIAAQTHAFLTDEKETLELLYLSSLQQTDETPLSVQYKQRLEETFEKDFYAGFTTVGPHRDDIGFLVNGTDVRAFGSQGQQRTVALSLKLAEIEIFRKLTGDTPILLLDDVLSELDPQRQKKLISFRQDVQILITATHLEEETVKGLTYSLFSVRDGIASPIP